MRRRHDANIALLSRPSVADARDEMTMAESVVDERRQAAWLAFLGLLLDWPRLTETTVRDLANPCPAFDGLGFGHSEASPDLISRRR